MTFPGSKDDWKFINTFAEWVSAFGSIFAAMVALYLSRTNHVKLKVDASMGALIGLTEKPLGNLLIISVVNCGIRPATITGIGIKCGLFFKRKFILIGGGIHPGISFPQEKLPKILEDGKKLDWIFTTGTKDSNDQIRTFAREMLSSGYNSKFKIFPMKIVAFTSVGKEFSNRVSIDIKGKIYNEIKILSKSGT